MVPFLHFESHGFCTDILFYNFHADFIEISCYWKFVMHYHNFEIMSQKKIINYQKKKGLC